MIRPLVPIIAEEFVLQACLFEIDPMVHQTLLLLFLAFCCFYFFLRGGGGGHFRNYQSIFRMSLLSLLVEGWNEFFKDTTIG